MAKYPLLLCWLALLAWSAPASAAVFDLVQADYGPRSLRLNISQPWPAVRGLLIFGNGAGGDSRRMATDPELVALAESLGFAVLATSQWNNFSDGLSGELARFEAALREFGALSGHAELTRVPWLPVGHSNGGQMSYGLNTLRPEKVIAMVVSKGGTYGITRPVAAALRTPGLLVAGEVDTEHRVTVIRDLFVGNRAAGALWAWVEDEGVGHEVAGSNDLTLPFVEAMAWARFPAATPVAADGTAALLPLDESAGWLTDPDSYQTGLADIAAFAAYPKDRTLAGWLPDRRLAYVFRAFATYRKAGTAVLSSGSVPITQGASVTYSIGEPAAAWTAIDFYEGDLALKRLVPADGAPLAVTATPAKPGFAVYHALVTFADGRQRTTPPRRVFVRAGPPVLTVSRAAPTGPVPAGTEVTLAVQGSDPQLGYAWYRDGERLPEFSGPTVTWVAGAIDAGNLSVVATDALGRTATAALGTLAVFSEARLTNLSARASVDAGDNVLIAGFVTTAADAAARKTVLVRGVGPELARSLGVTGALAAAQLRLFDAPGAGLAATDRWEPDLAAEFARLGAFPLVAGGRDAALIASVPRGVYTAHVGAGGGRAGIGLVEIYDADAGEPACRLANLAARAQVGSGDQLLIGGFVVVGSTAATVLIRAVGPALGRAPFNLAGVLAEPALTVFDAQGRAVATNRGWGVASRRGESPLRCGLNRATSAAMARLGAFALADGSADSAFVLALPPGAYSAHVVGATGGTGLGLVEIYEVR